LRWNVVEYDVSMNGRWGWIDGLKWCSTLRAAGIVIVLGHYIGLKTLWIYSGNVTWGLET
jgi:hypothetical protein